MSQIENASQIDVKPEAALGSIQTMLNGFIGLLPKLLLGLLVFVIFYFVARGVKALIRRSSQGKGIGKAIGFAFRDILQNYFAGILLLWREPFKVGDQIETTNGYIGTVTAVETRATTLKTYDGRRVVIPNSNLFTDSVLVNTARENRRSQYDIGIGYNDSIDEGVAALEEMINSGIEGVQTEPAPDVLVVDLAAAWVTLRVRWWTEPDRATVIKTQGRVLTGIKKTLDAKAIDMPYPTEVVLWHDQTEETDGDRSTQREGWPAGDKKVPKTKRIVDVLEKIAAGGAAQQNNQQASGKQVTGATD